MIAVVPVRQGQPPVDSDEVVAEMGGRALIVGDGTQVAAKELVALTHATCVELGDFAPGAWAVLLAPLVAEHDVVALPASPDGRDLAPRLAHTLGRPLLAGATEITATRVVLARWGGQVMEAHTPVGPVVATLTPGVRGVEPVMGEALLEVVDVTAATSASTAGPGGAGGPGGPGVPVGRGGPGRGAGSTPSGVHDAELVELVPPDPATVDLAEARRIVAGGAGLGGPEPFVLLEQVAVALGASFGATRVASDVGWAPHDRYIGTTGVAVDPELYVALGISGAVQHVTGLGQPDHVIAVNTDASAPMMAMADLALVTDARALLVELAQRLGVASTNAAADQPVAHGAGGGRPDARPGVAGG